MSDTQFLLDDPSHGAFCRTCGRAFATGTAWCATCGRKLISREEAAALDADTTDSITMVLLQAFPSGAEAGWAGSVLDAKGVPNRLDAVKSQLGTGARTEVRLFVAPERLDEARSILADSLGPSLDVETKRDREERSRSRRVRYMQVVLGFNAAWAALMAYAVARSVGGAAGIIEVTYASIWIVVFAFSLYKPRPAFAAAMSFGAAMLLLSVFASWADPQSREPFMAFLRQCLFVIFMYWGWQSARTPANGSSIGATTTAS